MAWLSNNWIWILLGVGFIAMHLFGHGRHGGHGGHGRHRDAQGEADHPVGDPEQSKAAATASDPSDASRPRRHGC